MSAPKKSPPLWRRVVDRVDALVTPPANSLVRTNAFADTVGMALRVEARLRRRIDDQTASVLHAANLPTAIDMRRIQAQLATLEGRIRDLSEQLDRQETRGD